MNKLITTALIAFLAVVGCGSSTKSATPPQKASSASSAALTEQAHALLNKLGCGGAVITPGHAAAEGAVTASCDIPASVVDPTNQEYGVAGHSDLFVFPNGASRDKWLGFAQSALNVPEVVGNYWVIQSGTHTDGAYAVAKTGGHLAE